MTPERVEEYKPYFTNEQLDELIREYQTMPTDGEGYAIEPEYNGMVARGDIIKVISDVKTARAALEQSQQTKLYKSHDQLREQNARLLMNNQKMQSELSEAQQTIARQQSTLKEAHGYLVNGKHDYWAGIAENILSAYLGLEVNGEPEFGTYAAHQPHYDSFIAHGRQRDYIYQALVHMGYATIEMGWANTVLSDMTDVPKGVINEMKAVTIQIDECKEHLREIDCEDSAHE